MYKKVIIIGAPRSGTNMLRNMLVKLDGVETWPCDEINYIWKHGNKNHPSDEFSPDMVNSAVKEFINKEFDQFAHSSNADTVIEKTCASSMRVGFVDEILPDAKYIFIVRDGLDTIASAKIRWKAKLDIPYLFKKVRYVPITDLPYYASKYIGSHLYKLFSKEKRVSFWGPQMKGLDQLLNKYSLSQVCALQWQTCVKNSERDFSNIDESRIIRVRYEDFTQNPTDEFQRIMQFIDKDTSAKTLESIVSRVSNKSVGKGRQSLSDKEKKDILPLISSSLAKYGYPND